MKVGDLVRYTPDGLWLEAWRHWRGVIIKEDSASANLKVVMWSRDNNVITRHSAGDLEVISEGR